jgi:hypothetical protein
MAALMGGHFFCLPTADGECWGGAAPMHGFAFFDFSLQNICVFFASWKK